jgi:hypothetical protein
MFIDLIKVVFSLTLMDLIKTAFKGRILCKKIFSLSLAKN